MKGLVSDLNLKNNIPMKLTSNINKKDSLVNGNFGYVCDVDEEKHIIWCMFSKKVGDITRNNFGKNHDIYTKAVPIVRITEQLKLKLDGKQYTF